MNARSDQAPIDQLSAELDQRAQLIRRSGAIPGGMELELEEAFDRLVPGPSGAGGSKELLDDAESAAFVDVAVPVGSRLPAGRLLKTLLRGSLSWYMSYVVNQVCDFSAATVRVMSALEGRLSALEVEATRRCEPVDPAVLPETTVDLGGWAELVAEETGRADGRVCHAESGAGELLAVLAARGADAYGVEPRPELARQAGSAGRETFCDSALAHLRGLERACLGGLILSGVVDRSAPGDQSLLAEQASRVLLGDGCLIVISSDPDRWGSGPAVVAADLASGRPLHPETWAFLLEKQGLAVRTVPAEGSFCVVGRRS